MSQFARGLIPFLPDNAARNDTILLIIERLALPVQALPDADFVPGIAHLFCCMRIEQTRLIYGQA